MNETGSTGEGRSTGGRRVALAALAVALVVAVLVVAVLLSGTTGASRASGSPATEAELRALPHHLAADAAAAGKVLEGSIAERIEDLHGIPVVVNQWASWCPNCRQEFPIFRQLARAFAGKVAFLGLDAEDGRGDAEGFLGNYPVPYLSIFDSDASQASSLGGGRGWPTTFFYDAEGGQTYLREGGYVTARSLRADIEEYALGR